MTDEQQLSVAVILVNWNGHLLTTACVESLNACNYSNFRIVIVDNGSSEASFKYIQEHCQGAVILRNEENLGFTGGNNLGMTWALSQRFDTIMLLNNDTIVHPDFLTHLTEELRVTTTAGAVQPKIYFEDDRERIWNAGGRWDAFLGISRTIGVGKIDVGQFDEARDVDWVTGCCMLINADTLREVGLLDDCFFAYYEDVDLSLRIRSRGEVLRYQPRAIVYHAISKASKSESKGKEGYISPRVHFFNVRNHLYLVRKHYRGIHRLSPYLFQLSKVMLMLGYFILRQRREKARMTFQGFKEGHTLTCM